MEKRGGVMAGRSRLDFLTYSEVGVVASMVVNEQRKVG